MNLIDLYKKHKKKIYMKKVMPYVHLSSQSCYENGFNVNLRHPQNEKIYLTIGNDCIIGGSFVFETEKGKISIGDRCHIGASQFISRTEISIGNDVTIAWGCTFYDHNSHSVEWNERKKDTIQEIFDYKKYSDPIKNKDWSNVKTAPIVIEDKVWVGLNVIILKGVTIGEGAVIGAGSVVTNNVEPWTLVLGNPAKVIKRLK